MPSVYIALSGKICSGKTSVARKLVEQANELGFKGHHMAQSTWLKFLTSRGLGRADREVLQKFGTDIVRRGCEAHFDNPYFWTNLLLMDVGDLEEKDPTYNFFVVEDVRYPAEYFRLRDNGFKMCRLHVTKEQQIQRSRNHPRDLDFSHDSETSLDCFDEDDWDVWFHSNFTTAHIAQMILDNVPGWFPHTKEMFK